MTCLWTDCWCRSWPPERLTCSTGVPYTVEELPAIGSARVFRYRYLEPAR